MCLDNIKEKQTNQHKHHPPTAQPTEFRISSTKLSLQSLTFIFNGLTYQINTVSVICLSLVVGLIGGIYGIGGGAIIAPFFVTLYKLPVHTVAGASLMGTFITSAVGVLFFQYLSTSSLAHAQTIAPDYRLGLLFGLGGAIGMYLGARAQRFFPATIIKSILTAALLFTACKYIVFG